MARIGKQSLMAVLLWILSALYVPCAWAGVLTGELDKSEGSLEDQFVYTLTIQGSFDNEPEFPAVDGLEARAAGKSQNISIVNGKYSKEVQVQFVLTPAREGLFSIPSLVLKVDGKDLQTLPLEIKVSAAASGGQDEAIFIERSFSKTTAYVGEAIAVKIKVFNRVKVVGAQPDFKYPSAFQVKNIEGQKSYTQMHAGNEYNVTELNAVLIASREGDFKIDPALLIARVASARRQRPRSFFDEFTGATELQEKRLRSADALLKVLPLPVEGRRKDFSGLVGEFSIAADVNPRSGKVGDTLNVSVTVKGQGVSSSMSDPTLPFDPGLAKIYKDKPESSEELDATNGIFSQKTFKYAIVPQSPHLQNLGRVMVQVFNPAIKSYEDLEADLGAVHIEGAAVADPATAQDPAARAAGHPLPRAASNGKPQAEKKGVELLGQDLIEPHPVEALTRSDRIAPAEWIFGGLLMVFSFGGIGVSAWMAGTRATSAEVLQRRRAAKAFAAAKKQLSLADQYLRKQDLSTALRTAQSCFKDYTGAKFGVPGAAITLRDIEGLLRTRDVDKNTLLALREVWSGLDQMIYAPPLGQSPEQGQELLAKTQKLVEQMERQC